MPTTKKVTRRLPATFYGCGIYVRDPLAEIKPCETRRNEKRRRRRSYLRQAEHRRRNEVRKKHLPQQVLFAVTRF